MTVEMSPEDKKMWDLIWKKSEERMVLLMSNMLDESHHYIEDQKKEGKTNDTIVKELFDFSHYRQTVETLTVQLKEADALSSEDIDSGISPS